jgi:hypothetical protein
MTPGCRHIRSDWWISGQDIGSRYTEKNQHAQRRRNRIRRRKNKKFSKNSFPILDEVVLKHLIVSCPTNKLQKDCHSRAGGSPAQSRLDSRLRGNDGQKLRLRR